MKTIGKSTSRKLFALFVFVFLTACSVHSKVEILNEEPEFDRSYSALGEIQANCTRRRCKEVTLSACLKKLQKAALELSADGIILYPPLFTESGPHQGGEIVGVRCRGLAIDFSEN
jgi:hypothetical protein